MPNPVNPMENPMVQQTEFVPNMVASAHTRLHNFAESVSSFIDKQSPRRRGIAIVAAGVLAVSACGGTTDTAEPAGNGGTVTTIETPGTSPETVPEVCAESWEMPGVDHGDQNKWFGQGLQEIFAATDNETARVASDAWVNGTTEHPGIKHDDKLLVAGYNAVMKPAPEAVLTVEGLMDEDSCATDKATLAIAELEATLATSKIEAVDQVPEDWVNTGTDSEGNVTVAGEAGVYGDTKAIRIETPDGNVVYVMARCGQPVIHADQPIPGDVPVGETDNPHNPLKNDPNNLPGDPNVPADRDHSTPDVPGNGPVGQPVSPDGTIVGETPPTAPRQPVTPTTPENTTPATTSPNPVVTNPPVVITTPSTLRPDPTMPVKP